MKILEEIGVYFFYFFLVYSLAILLSSINRAKKYLIGVRRVPLILRFWIVPRWLYSAERESARLIGILYHCIFSFSSIIMFLPFSIALFSNIDLALEIRDIWFAISIAIGTVFLIIVVVLEAIKFLNVTSKKYRRR